MGKTLSKISLWSKDGRCLEKITRPNERPEAAPYLPLDTAAATEWLLTTLPRFSHHPIEAIIPVAHGAAIAGIRKDASAFAPPDYEWDMPAPDHAAYRAQRDPFSVTGSPRLPAGLNIGSQLHYLDHRQLLQDATLLPYAQYWAWLLSGVAVSEITSLGCHSDLWSPATGDFSPMAKQRGWAEQFAQMVQAGDVIGTLRPEIASRTGLSSQVRIHAGLHDSNAALLAARAWPEIGAQEATVLSTGTWFIAMHTPASPIDLAALPRERDCLVNIDACGKAVPSARFMGGREMELLGARIDHAGTAGLADVLHSGAYVLPGQVPGCGPFPGMAGGWINPPRHSDALSAAAALYAALMADASLDLIGAKGTILVEGRFASSEIFVRALASLRPDTQLYTAGMQADVAFGALRLLLPSLPPKDALVPVKPLDRDLSAYRDGWYDAIKAFS